MEKLHGSKLYSKMDISNGYGHMRIKKSHRKYTSFLTPFGKFQYCYGFYGGKNFPGKFGQMMEKIFVEEKQADPYFDDLLIFTKDDIKEHYDAVSRVAKISIINNIIYNIVKMELGKYKMEFVGKMVENGSFYPTYNYIKKLKCLKPLKDSSDSSKVTGNYGWVHKHIPGLAYRTFHLNKMKRKDAPKEITKEALQEFYDLKDIVNELIVLKAPDYSLPFVLVVDASQEARAMALFQFNVIKAKLHPIEFRSNTFNGSELNWHINDKELFTLVYYICACRHHLIRAHFTIFTDSSFLIRRLMPIIRVHKKMIVVIDG